MEDLDNTMHFIDLIPIIEFLNFPSFYLHDHLVILPGSHRFLILSKMDAGRMLPETLHFCR